MLMKSFGFIVVPLTGVLFLACTGKSSTLPPPVPVVDHIDVSPATISVEVGLTQQLTAKALDASGVTVPGVVVVWASDADTIATVDQRGMVTAALPGTARISASAKGKTGVSVVTVPVPAIASITLLPNSGSFEIGETIDLVPTVKDVLGHTVILALAWLSNSPAVATVTSAGEVTGITTGPVRITATAGGVQGIADFVFIPMSVTKITVTPQAPALFIGETTPLSAHVESANGTVLTDRPVTWQSRNEFIASVSSSGELTAVGLGTVWIIAQCEGNLDSALVTVSVRPPAGYDIEIVNHLLGTVQVAFNGAGTVTLPSGASVDVFRSPEAVVRVAWGLIPPTDLGQTIGETVNDTFPQAAGPDGARLHFEIGATLTDGRRLVFPALQNTSPTTVRVSFGIKETITPCACVLPSGEPESTAFGYWFLPVGQTLRVYGRGDAAHTGPFVSIPIPPADVDPLTGLWHFIIVAGP